MKRYDKEFREQALKLSDEVGIRKASEQLGVVYGTLADWRKKRVRKNKNKKTISINPDDEIARLKKIKKFFLMMIFRMHLRITKEIRAD